MPHLHALPSISKAPVTYGPTRTQRQALTPSRIATTHDLDLMRGLGLPQVGNVVNLPKRRAQKAARALVHAILGPDNDGPKAA